MAAGDTTVGNGPYWIAAAGGVSSEPLMVRAGVFFHAAILHRISAPKKRFRRNGLVLVRNL
jgi:hypothetical protein